tara:strand:- start:200 stop:598 length:399 start_codon:yes stop_codon:yes gene_type:complete
MANYYQYKPGLGAVGQYQVSGKPFITGSVDCSGGPTEIVFPSVTSWIVLQNHDTVNTLNVAVSENGLPSQGGDNYFQVLKSGTYAYWSVPSLDLKVTSLWVEGSTDTDVLAGLTAIEVSEIPNNWSGSSGVG